MPHRAAPRHIAAATPFCCCSAIGLAVTIFRGAYEQIGNTVAPCGRDVGIDRAIGGVGSIPMTWFQSLNPLLVILMTPLLLARWKRQRREGRELRRCRRWRAAR